MKFLKSNIIPSIVYLLVLSFFMGGCAKAPKNGNLDGMWEVMEVFDGTESMIPEKRIFYNFSLDVCQLTYYGAGATFTYGIVTYEDDILMIDFPSSLGEYAIETLKDYGIFSNPVIFNVNFPSKTRMILSDGDIKVSLRKF